MIKIGNLQIIETGTGSFNKNSRQLLANKYGFDFYNVGENVPSDVKNGIYYYNKTMVKYLEEKHGPGWWEQFQGKLNHTDVADISDNNIEPILNLVRTHKLVKNQIQRIDSLSNGQRHISLIPILEDSIRNIYLINVVEKNEKSLVPYYNFRIDANTMSIINIKGKIDGQY